MAFRSHPPQIRAHLAWSMLHHGFPSDMGAFVVDLSDMTFVAVTDTLAALAGYSSVSELEGRHMDVVIEPGLRHKHGKKRAIYAADPDSEPLDMGDRALICKDGSLKTFRIRVKKHEIEPGVWLAYGLVLA